MSSPYRTLVDLIDSLRNANPEHGLLLIDSRGREIFYSWPALHRKVRQHAARLKAEGIGRGDRVIVSPTNEPEVLASFLALFYLGAVPLSVSGIQLGQEAGTQLPFIKSLIEMSGTGGVFAQTALIAGNEQSASIPPEMLIDYVPSSVELDEEPHSVEPARVSEDDLALVQFSSGSTSRPKGVRLTHRNLISNLQILADYTRRPDEVCVSWLPLYHDMGLLGVTLASFWYPARLQVLMHPVSFLMKPVTWLANLSKYRARVSVCPNFALDLCTDRIPHEQLVDYQIDLSALEQVFVGAEPVRPSSLQRFEDRFGEWGFRKNVLAPVYGMAEASLIITGPEFREEVPVKMIQGQEIPSVGRPLGDFQLRISREDGAEAARGEIGELWIKGSSVTEGYLDEYANGELFSEGWLRSGDLGQIDEKGRVYITGRIKDLIVVSGKN
ncbi:MAG: AMP-binding protein, partial [Acidobacteriota bacterium]